MNSSVRLKDVSVGDELPGLDVPLTPAIIVGGALASRDFTPVHHDRGYAESQGLSDVIMNILTTNGYVSRYVTDWAGPDAVVKEVSIKLGAPNMPGDTMKMSGKVVSSDADVIEIEVVGKNAWGNHVNGTVWLTLPSGD
jgi:acyl dehydratase